MRIQCNVCGVEEANVLCCADEAALCWACDEKVHAANKLASKHQRVPLSSSSSPIPKCDICQEAVGYFFCLEDRALLCRKCDVAIHTANPYVSAHQRFLLTGVKVEPESTESGGSTFSGKPHPGEKTSEAASGALSKRGKTTTMGGQYSKVSPMQAGGVGDLGSPKLPFAGGSAAGSVPQWQVDDFMGFAELNQNSGYMDNGSSKADSGKFGDSDYTPFLRVAEEELDGDECLGQVPDATWMVPQIPSPPTASGLYWPKNYRNPSETSIFVPDICYSMPQNPRHCQLDGISPKRRRQF